MKVRENCYAWSITFFILGIIIIPFIKTVEWRLDYFNPFTLVFNMIGMAFLIAAVIRGLRDTHFNHYVLNKDIQINKIERRLKWLKEKERKKKH